VAVTPKLFPALSSVPYTGTDPLGNEVALKLGDNRNESYLSCP